MKVLLCNKYFFINGGQEKYMADLMRGFPRFGHKAVPFSVRYAGSWDSSYIPFFLPPPGDARQTHLHEIHLGLKSLARHIDRSIYSFEAKKYLHRLLKKEPGISIAYLLNIYNYMSPSIIHTLVRLRIPVVMQLGDYHMLCPNYLLLRDGRPCTRCIPGKYFFGIRYRCVQKNLAASILRVTSMYIHRAIRIYRHVSAFVVPCDFMKKRMVEGGFPESKIHILQYPVVDEEVRLPEFEKKQQIIYFGRISFEKGIDTLIKAFADLNPPVLLLIVGRGEESLIRRLKALIPEKMEDRIQFVGFKTGETLFKLVGESLFSVVPSRWYDNAPISINESFLLKTPVVASDIGGISEQVKDGIFGKLVRPDDPGSLKDAIKWMLSDDKRLKKMGKAAKQHVIEHLDLSSHILKLERLFNRLISRSAGSI